MLRAIRESGRDVGFKAAGGIRDTAAAGDYLALADRIMGPACRSSALPFRCQRPARRPARPAGRRGWQARWRKLLMALLPQEIIRKKRDGAALGDGEIEALVAGIADGSLGEGQGGAFHQVAYLCGLNAHENVARGRGRGRERG